MFVPKQSLGTSSVVISIPYVPCQGGLRPLPFPTLPRCLELMT